ncbi:SPOR domain-containing protein [Duganella sp. FT92W]|uniref:SPOR domain-containing protein n=1 Tax=Pseudoduganella rivuli TaxID=2666085 RepID=A0A7X2INS5_9BURK|nr:SPOR domain-containing protein [Pseudoduganella rivuli]MRV73264.1 SPOR domain-containing protein [Pseudoduganella rivuli]
MHFRSRLAPLRHQQGNTLVGIVIGLVIGLAIAVVVALVISKGSSPFTDKSGKVGKPAEPTAGQISDPNKPMYGNKDAAREAARDFSKEQRQPTEGVPPPAAPPAQPPKDELQQVVDRIEAASKKPAAAPAAAPATAAPAAPAAAAAAPAAGDDKYVYYLQAGAFREMSDAENQRAKLALMGFEATVSDRTTDAGVLHRVRMGPFAQVEAMNKARSKLSENGVDVSVVRNQR